MQRLVLHEEVGCFDAQPICTVEGRMFGVYAMVVGGGRVQKEAGTMVVSYISCWGSHE
jgi:hypothetical protein